MKRLVIAAVLFAAQSVHAGVIDITSASGTFGVNGDVNGVLGVGSQVRFFGVGIDGPRLLACGTAPGDNCPTGFGSGPFVSLVDNVYTWEGGGTLWVASNTLINRDCFGTSCDVQLPVGRPLEGTVIGPVTATITDECMLTAGGGVFSPCMAIEGQGIDVKDETMLEFLGFSGQPWAFSYRFEIGLNLLEFDDDGSFRCIGPGCGSNEFGETRIINTQIPEPTTLALIALGLAGLGFAGRRRLQS